MPCDLETDTTLAHLGGLILLENTMIFTTKISGIPCQCEVIGYFPASPMCITGSGFGDADPPEFEDIEYQILDRKGYNAPWLSKKLTREDDYRLRDEFAAACLANKYGIDY